MHNSLHELELQCKERVDLLEALKQSRSEAEMANGSPGSGLDPTPSNSYSVSNPSIAKSDAGRVGWLGEGTVPPVDYPDISRPHPLPQRPSAVSRKSSDSEVARTRSLPSPNCPLPSPLLSSAPALSSSKKVSRTPSPDKRGGLLRTLRPAGKDQSRSSSKMQSTLRDKPPAAAKAATQAWDSISKANGQRPMSSVGELSTASAAVMMKTSAGRPSLEMTRSREDYEYSSDNAPSSSKTSRTSPFYFKLSSQEEISGHISSNKTSYIAPDAVPSSGGPSISKRAKSHPDTIHSSRPEQHRNRPLPHRPKSPKSPPPIPRVKPKELSYRNEYPQSEVMSKKLAIASAARANTSRSTVPGHSSQPVPRRRVVPPTSSRPSGTYSSNDELVTSSGSGDEPLNAPRISKRKGKAPVRTGDDGRPLTPSTQASDTTGSDDSPQSKQWKERVDRVMKHLPRGVDEAAARQIFNEIVIHGDEVHWNDVAGLEIAKAALKETVVYPFLRPDLFMGLREPARGMLLFGPPGTGKTMLARAVATESKSTFFAISASSLTSKYLGESEKLVRALFALAKVLAPSIIFVDEIDSLLSSRSGAGEHEATRRIKTEFLIQWSDLAKAAAGREQSEKEKFKGDANRVLVLAATNLPWAIDEAARRRFVRRQYIPLPEDHVRKLQLRTLLSHQKHGITENDLDRLVRLTSGKLYMPNLWILQCSSQFFVGFSGSDITALAKDAAMGPLRSLGEKLLNMTMDEIRPIQMQDFEASLQTIRPSVSKQGLKQFEEWAREFGERGG